MKSPRFCRTCGRVLEDGKISHGYDAETGQRLPSTLTRRCSYLDCLMPDFWLWKKTLFRGYRWVDGNLEF